MSSTASVASYLVSAYIDCLEQLSLTPQITVSIKPSFDRRANYKNPRLVNGFMIPEDLLLTEYVNITVDTYHAFNRNMDHKFGVYSFNCFYKQVNTCFSLPIEHIVSVQSTDDRVKFMLSAEDHGRFIVLQDKPKLKLVK